MKPNTLTLSALMSLLFVTATPSAARCYWSVSYYDRNPISTDTWHSTFNTPSLNLTLAKVSVGQVLGSVNIETDRLAGTAICTNDTINVGAYVKLIHPREKVPGFNNVYESGIPGVGVRYKAIPNLGQLPVQVGPGKNWTYGYFLHTLVAEFVRTGSNIGSSTSVTLEPGFEMVLDGWTAQSTRGSVQINVKNEYYFSGCASTSPLLNVPMGKVIFSQLNANQAPIKHVDLDIRCMGLSHEKAPPVKIYFEGNNAGAGLLNLAAQNKGATGVQLALENDKGQPLPFSKSNALTMDWDHTDSQGEIYRLPIKARYVKSGASMTPGRADAEVSYVIEYN
ncbi:fimbrial protein [Pseudomonas protegens]|uniref:fimbrial protein n=2 Tax=Pseudomonas protegens TaxID=380021 RepID=UPI0038184B9D